MKHSLKTIYNLYLKAYRVNNNKPFSPRKNFDFIEKEDYYFYLLKLDSFFSSHPYLLNDHFFNAPYKIYSDEKKYYPLKFYASSKGLSTCISYFKILRSSSPDEQLDYILDSLRFIKDFCVDKKIPLSEYGSYKSVNQNDFFKHLKEYKISWYIVCGISELYNKLYNMPEDEFLLYFGEVEITSIRDRLENSEHAKNLIKKGWKKIDKSITEYLKSNVKDQAQP